MREYLHVISNSLTLFLCELTCFGMMSGNSTTSLVDELCPHLISLCVDAHSVSESEESSSFLLIFFFFLFPDVCLSDLDFFSLLLPEKNSVAMLGQFCKLCTSMITVQLCWEKLYTYNTLISTGIK